MLQPHRHAGSPYTVRGKECVRQCTPSFVRHTNVPSPLHITHPLEAIHNCRLLLLRFACILCALAGSIQTSFVDQPFPSMPGRQQAAVRQLCGAVHTWQLAQLAQPVQSAAAAPADRSSSRAATNVLPQCPVLLLLSTATPLLFSIHRRHERRVDRVQAHGC